MIHLLTVLKVIKALKASKHTMICSLGLGKSESYIETKHDTSFG